MIGAVIGDIIGSRLEKNNIKRKDFDFFTKESRFTDDTVLTIAIADCILNSKDYEKTVKNYGRAYPFAGYGGTFKKWLGGIIKGPYNSWGNGSAMRVSPVGFAFEEEEKVLEEAKKSAEITHNHIEGIKGAQAIAMAVFLGRKGKSKDEIKAYTEQKFGYDLNRTIDEIRPDYKFDVSCQGSVPESIIAFLESENFEDAIRNAISIGGDSDTIASMTGAISEAYYKSVPDELIERMNEYLPEKFKNIMEDFSKRFYD
jgi:ADP-ribosylglycohydrolase